MLKGELEILNSIALNKCKMKQILNCQIARDNVYVMATFDSMVKNGFIQESKSKEYQLTLKGIRVLLKFSKNSDITRRILRDKLYRQYSDNSYAQLWEDNY